MSSASAPCPTNLPELFHRSLGMRFFWQIFCSHDSQQRWSTLLVQKRLAKYFPNRVNVISLHFFHLNDFVLGKNVRCLSGSASHHNLNWCITGTESAYFGYCEILSESNTQSKIDFWIEATSRHPQDQCLQSVCANAFVYSYLPVADSIHYSARGGTADRFPSLHLHRGMQDRLSLRSAGSISLLLEISSPFQAHCTNPESCRYCTCVPIAPCAAKDWFQWNSIFFLKFLIYCKNLK